MQLLDAVCHMPPAFSQSALVWYFVKSLLMLPLPDGLAEGEVVLLPAPDPVVAPPLDGELVLGLLDGLELEPEPVPPDPPLPVWAATTAGVSAIVPTRSAYISFCIWQRPP